MSDSPEAPAETNENANEGGSTDDSSSSDDTSTSDNTQSDRDDAADAVAEIFDR